MDDPTNVLYFLSSRPQAARTCQRSFARRCPVRTSYPASSSTAKPGEKLSSTRMSRPVQRFCDPTCRSGTDGGEPGNNASLRARWGHSYPAEQGVPDQDASCRANPARGGGTYLWRRQAAPSSSGHTPPPPDRRTAGAAAPIELVAQAAFTRAPSGSSPAVTYLHKATSSFLAKATAVILRIRPRTEPTRSVNQRASALSGW